MWRPTAHTPEEVERFRARRREARVRHVACHALYLVNLASRDPEVRVEVVRRARRDDGDGTGDRCRHGRLPRRLAPRLRLRRRGARGGSRASRAPFAHDGGPLAVPRERRRRRRDDRAVGRRARRHLRRARRARAAGHLPRLVSLVGVRRRRDEPGGAGRGARRSRRAGRARPPPPAARQRREDAARLEPRPARGRRATASSATGLATFLGHPAFRELPAVLETWPEGGLSTADMDLLRTLRRRGQARWRRRSPAPARA